MKIYLAGGMQSEWRTKLTLMLQEGGRKDDILFNPLARDRGDYPQYNAWNYTTWDLFHIAQSDIVIAYMETDNPSGIGLAAEMGYAKGKGILALLVLDPDLWGDKRFFFIQEMADRAFQSLQECARFVNSFQC